MVVCFVYVVGERCRPLCGGRVWGGASAVSCAVAVLVLHFICSILSLGGTLEGGGGGAEADVGEDEFVV